MESDCEEPDTVPPPERSMDSDSSDDIAVTSATLYKEKTVYLSSANRADGKRLCNKHLACYFCGKLYRHRIAKHLVLCHTNEPKVIAACRSTELKKRLALDALKHLGNFRHNSKVLTEGKGEIIVVRRPKHNDVIAKDYVPCAHCFGFFRKNELWRHSRSCHHKSGDSESHERFALTNGRMLLAGSLETDTDSRTCLLQSYILVSMRQDKYYDAICNDLLIKNYGAILLQKLGRCRKRDMMRRLRHLARLKFLLNETTNKEQGLIDYLTPQFFEDCMNCTTTIAGMHQNQKDIQVFQIPSYALHIGHHLRKCAEIKRGIAIRKQNDNMLNDAKLFLNLLASEWTDRVSSIALATLQTNQFNKRLALPLTQDVVLLKSYLVENLKQLNKDIVLTPSYAKWCELAEIALVRIILFNRCGYEAAMLLVKTFQSRLDGKKNAHQELMNSLQPVEKKLLERLDMVEMQGIRIKSAPILLTEDVKKAIENLIKYKGDVGQGSNIYVFGDGRIGHLSPCPTVNKHAKLAGCKKPSLVSSTKLQKYIATTCQVGF